MKVVSWLLKVNIIIIVFSVHTEHNFIIYCHGAFVSELKADTYLFILTNSSSMVT